LNKTKTEAVQLFTELKLSFDVRSRLRFVTSLFQ